MQSGRRITVDGGLMGRWEVVLMDLGGIPELATERLVLRSFQAEDAEAVRRLAGEREVAATAANLPHPYSDGVAAA